ncbi:malonyl CoA-acyl carrier protein transacylase [Ktedonobacteria bacterium brp13]|nr:malonyl CoA-acyl carrier protein transacylase [Ktedonobacteria bacterium brp13]
MTTQVAFLFPGQGSQNVGMGADVYAASAAARQVFATFDDVLGIPLSTLCFEGPEDTLRATINAQPAIVAVSLAYLAAFQEALSPATSSWSIPLTPAYTAGHSVGECTALVAAGAINVQDVAFLVRERGRLMQQEEQICPGGMAAIIGLDTATLQTICEEVSAECRQEIASGVDGVDGTSNGHPGQGSVILANYNAPGQIVISGEQRALERACARAREQGAKRAIPLAVSGAFHSPVMQPATEKLASSVAQIALQDTTIPVIGNIQAAPLTTASALRNELANQIASSVQWIRTIEFLVEQGVTTFFEIGPGQALAGMNKRIARGVTTINIGSVADIEKALAKVKELNLVS